VKKLVVLSLNLRFGLADDGPNSWIHRKQGVVKLFRKYDPDLIATQEANHFQADFLAQSLPGYDTIGRRRPAPKFWQDNILFFKNELVCTEAFHFFLSETPDVPSRSYGSRFPRQATIGLFDLDGQALICVNTHLDFETPAHMGALRVIEERLSAHGDTMPTILVGDFNATPESPCYQWLTGKAVDGMTGRPFRETFRRPYPGTIHRFTGIPTGDYIDWILYRGPLRFKRCEVLHEQVEGIYPSDHFPVTASFELPDVP
jgi:endonuclease/exonuclease/phosphatase family metal-dependent hydrolase